MGSVQLQRGEQRRHELHQHPEIEHSEWRREETDRAGSWATNRTDRPGKQKGHGLIKEMESTKGNERKVKKKRDNQKQKKKKQVKRREGQGS